MRRFVLERAKDLHLSVRQDRLPLEAFRGAEEVFMTNAVAGIVSVGLIQAGRESVRVPSIETAGRLRARLELE
jgi:branched-subunit amino acid aminotransferase/4-amino-4-deoxychorismate lyase